MAEEMIWSVRFMGLCDHLAGWSEDRDFQVGCVIVGPDGHEVRATGYNGLRRGVLAVDASRFDRASGEKFYWFEHAERNAIYNAARMGASLQGCTAYVNRFPCADCGRALIQSGIVHLVAPPIPEADGALDYSFQVSQQMLCEAGMVVTLVPEKAEQGEGRRERNGVGSMGENAAVYVVMFGLCCRRAAYRATLH